MKKQIYKFNTNKIDVLPSYISDMKTNEKKNGFMKDKEKKIDRSEGIGVGPINPQNQYERQVKEHDLRHRYD